MKGMHDIVVGSLWLGRCKTNACSTYSTVFFSLCFTHQRTGAKSPNPSYNSERWITWPVEAMKTVAKCEKDREPLFLP